jgi:hypothetical protein
MISQGSEGVRLQIIELEKSLFTATAIFIITDEQFFGLVLHSIVFLYLQLFSI